MTEPSEGEIYRIPELTAIQDEGSALPFASVTEVNDPVRRQEFAAHDLMAGLES
jgi:hypothetical protein